ncbi:MAG: hypothetical protein ABI416_05705 [Ginsengibacter sp.]
MFKNNFKVGWRDPVKDLQFIHLNKIGLIVSLTRYVLIYLSVNDKSGYPARLLIGNGTASVNHQ